jgi:hypothetical protein
MTRDQCPVFVAFSLKVRLKPDTTSIQWRWGPTPAPQRELSLMPRLGFACPRLGTPPQYGRGRLSDLRVARAQDVKMMSDVAGHDVGERSHRYGLATRHPDLLPRNVV